ncbi:centrosomal protein POC5 isoform X2 [Rhinatrema bivittatum]|uniref:centrosomal protein POC5 isoform X2 n=1 Tax=Rhinatrema bivittatum TaxID=194408 RepID=UPI001127BC71|nr:centrosomal protein POC5 isoform X2 [Rhinatrema bivittatum]
MSSDEESCISPILPKDSDRGSSVSSDLQDEYEELLRYAVVTPKFEQNVLRQTQLTVEQPKDGKFSGVMNDDQPQAAGKLQLIHGGMSELQDIGPSERELCIQGLTTVPEDNIPETSVRDPRTLEREDGLAAPISSGTESIGESESSQNRLFQSAMDLISPAESEEATGQNISATQTQIEETIVTELPVPNEKMSEMESLLDTWSGNLKTNVMSELSKWRLTMIEEHKLEMKRHQEKHAEYVNQLYKKIDNLKDLLRTYETSTQRKDEVISNLTHAIERQKKKVELMRTFTHWRLQHADARQEAYMSNLATRHYTLALKQKFWRAWHSVIKTTWKNRVEEACRARAEEICIQLYNDYEARTTELNGALDEARAEIQRLHGERQRFEGSMKKAFMRGVCALNMETMSVFQGKESRMDHDHSNRREESGPSSSVPFQSQTATSADLKPAQFDLSVPQMTTIAPEPIPMTRVVTSAQQKAGKTITARVTGRSDLGQRSNRVGSNLNTMAVSPPMSSVVVEKHHPITQQTISHATAAKYPRTTLLTSVSGRMAVPSGRSQSVHPTVQSIKVVD